MREEPTVGATDGSGRVPLDALPDPAVAYGTDGDDRVIRSINDVFEETFDTPVSPGDSLASLPGWESVSGAVPDAPTTVGIAVDGDERTYSVRASGTEEGVVAYADISELGDRLDRIRAQRDRLDEFAGVLAHDLRNPLEVASARTELARELGSDEHLEKVEGALERMEEVVARLLDLAREGAVVGDTETLSLADCARSAWDTVATADATLTVEDDPTVDADSARLRELFENLFANAVKHGGPTVTVRVGSVTDDGRPVGFYVADDGAGIPSEKRANVFEPGFTTADDGTGFGLTVVDRIAAGHGWEVTVDEGAGGGARFDVVDFAGTGVSSD